MNISKVALMVCTGLFGVILFISPAANADWYADPVNPLWNWAHRQKIMINPEGTRVPSQQNDFPVLVKITDPANPIFGTARPDGDDILFTKDDEITKIPHELTLFRDTAPKETVAWVRIETLGTGPTTIYMYYGCPDASSQENAAGVWDAGFKMVTHLNETAGGWGAVKDSTSNNNHATNGGSYPQPPTFGAPGSLGHGVHFHGGGMWASYGGHISVPHNSSLDITGPFTVEAWIKARGSDNYLMIVDKYYGNGWNSCGFTFYMVGGSQGKGRIRLSTYGGSVHDNLVGSRTDLQRDTWHHVAGVFDGANMHLYVDGVLDATKASVLSPASTGDDLSIGKRTCGWGGYSPFLGTIDEVRLSGTGRSADWIRTCYENQSSPATFLAFFPEEEGDPFEVALGANTPEAATAEAPLKDLPMLQIRLTASSHQGAVVTALRFVSTGTGDASSGVTARLYLDMNGDGRVSPQDPEMGFADIDKNDGSMNFTGLMLGMLPGITVHLLVAYDFEATAKEGTYGLKLVDPMDVEATGAISLCAIEVTGTPFEGAEMTIWVDPGEPVFFQGGCAGGGRSCPAGWAAWLFLGIAGLVLLRRNRKVLSNNRDGFFRFTTR